MKIYREIGSLYIVSRKDAEGYERPVYEIEVDEITMCKDCRWGKECCGYIKCMVGYNAQIEYHEYDWFCPVGEKNACANCQEFDCYGCKYKHWRGE